jgi:hypothetical protein
MPDIEPARERGYHARQPIVLVLIDEYHFEISLTLMAQRFEQPRDLAGSPERA